MDLTKVNPISVSYGNGRTHVGKAWMTGGHDRSNYYQLTGTIHSSLTCSSPRDIQKMFQVSIYTQDDKLYATIGETSTEAMWCPQCPAELEWKWQDNAQCRGTSDIVDFFDEDYTKHEAMIEDFCNYCPVISDCLEFGGAMHPGRIAGVWGGISFITTDSVKQREVKVESQRVRIRQGL